MQYQSKYQLALKSVVNIGKPFEKVFIQMIHYDFIQYYNSYL